MFISKSDILNNTENKKFRILSVGSLMALLIAISPYLFYLYESFPNNTVWQTSFFEFRTEYYPSLYVAAWTIINKLVPLMLLTIWFFTCKHWWYHVILIPISMYILQLLSSLNAEAQYVDEFEIYYIIPVMMIVVPIVYIIRIKLVDKYVHGIDMEKIDQELDSYKNKENEL